MVGEFNNLKEIIREYLFERIEENHKKDSSERYKVSIAFI
jgi:hypothetical protein